MNVKLLIEKSKNKITIELKSNSIESSFLVTIHFMFLKIKTFDFCNFDREKQFANRIFAKKKN